MPFWAIGKCIKWKPSRFCLLFSDQAVLCEGGSILSGPPVRTMHLCVQPVSNRFSSWWPSIGHLTEYESRLQNEVKFGRTLQWVWGRWDEMRGRGRGCRVMDTGRRDSQASVGCVGLLMLSQTMPALCCWTQYGLLAEVSNTQIFSLKQCAVRPCH